MKVFDAHIHLFEKPYGALHDNSHIKDGPEGEPHLYEEYRRAFDIVGAFVICHQDAGRRWNNCYVSRLSRERGWIHSFGFVQANPDTAAEAAAGIMEGGHFGISCYLESDDDAAWLAGREMSSFWSFLEDRRAPVSFNLSAFQCRPLAGVLRGHPGATVLISHMARPRVVDGRLDEKDYRPLLDLAEFPGAWVKLSGFYAFVDDGWRYPQAGLFTVVDRLKEVFGPKRLLFASDFPPVLEYNTFRQAVELLRTGYRGFSEEELEDVYWKNADGLMAELSRGRG